MCLFQRDISLLIIKYNNNCLPYLENDDKSIQLIPSIVGSNSRVSVDIFKYYFC